LSAVVQSTETNISFGAIILNIFAFDYDAIYDTKIHEPRLATYIVATFATLLLILHINHYEASETRNEASVQDLTRSKLHLLEVIRLCMAIPFDSSQECNTTWSLSVALTLSFEVPVVSRAGKNYRFIWRLMGFGGV